MYPNSLPSSHIDLFFSFLNLPTIKHTSRLVAGPISQALATSLHRNITSHVLQHLPEAKGPLIWTFLSYLLLKLLLTIHFSLPCLLSFYKSTSFSFSPNCPDFDTSLIVKCFNFTIFLSITPRMIPTQTSIL